MNYEEWCEGKSIEYLAKKIESSKPEEILGFYLSKFFGDELEYHKKFDWLNSKSHIDIYVASKNLAIEYDGPLHNIKGREDFDKEKKLLCKRKGMEFIRIKGLKKDERRTRGDICYFYENNCSNIVEAMEQLGDYINKKYNLNIEFDVDIKRDEEEIMSYVREKYYKQTIAYKWFEVKDYWSSKNEKSIFDVLCSDSKQKINLICPRCGESYERTMRNDYRKKSLHPCENCEISAIKAKVSEAIKQYEEQGILIVFDESLESRRIYDQMASRALHPGARNSETEKEMYIKLGFECN